jgi:hypothetical protein
MKKNPTFVRHTLSEVEALRERGFDKTRPDAPRAKPFDEDFWKLARVTTRTRL